MIRNDYDNISTWKWRDFFDTIKDNLIRTDDFLKTKGQRRYSVGEVDEMRRKVKNKYYSGFTYNSVFTITSPPESYFEDKVRTYMLGGVDPEDIK